MVHYKRAFETEDLEKKKKHLKDHANSYIAYAKSLKEKDYTSAVSRRTRIISLCLFPMQLFI